MNINKKYGFIFLFLGLVLFAAAGFYLLSNRTTNDSNDDNNDNNNTSIKMAYIKSRDINKKTKVAFPIYEKMIDDNYNKDEYNVAYKNKDEKIYIDASTVESNLTLEDYDNYYLETYYKGLETVGLTYETYKEECDYYCKRYKIYRDNKIIDDSFIIYIKLSEGDIAELKLYSNDHDLPEELIAGFKNDIKITNDALYKIGKVDNGKLIFDFNINEKKDITVKLDNNKYEEVENSVNTLYITTLKNKNNKSLIRMTLRKRQMGMTINDDLDYYFKNEIVATKTEEVIQDDKIFYKYIANDKIYYAYIIDDDTTLLLESSEIELSDFSNIEITNK